MTIRGLAYSYLVLAAALVATPASAKSRLNPAQQGFADLISFANAIESEFAYPVDLNALEDRVVNAAIAELPSGWTDGASCSDPGPRARRPGGFARNLDRRLSCLRVNSLPPSAGGAVLQKMIDATIAGLEGHATLV